MRISTLLFIVCVFISCRAFSQLKTPNIGFEQGSFNNWQCYIGKIDSVGNVTVAESGATLGRHTIIDKNTYPQKDPIGNFPVLCPNGSKYSVMLGNMTAGAQAERITYTFVVPDKDSYSIIFNYAVVLENPNHEPFQQPKFTAQIYNVTDGTYISCPSFDFVASSDLPGFKLATSHGAQNAGRFFKDWSTATIDLRGFRNKTLRLEFTTNDCTKVQHFGYAYIDVDENSEFPITGNSYCVGQTSMTLYAPIGFASYDWYTGDLKKKVGTGPTLTVSPPPPDKTGYALKIKPYEGLGCIDTLYTVVNSIDEGFRLKVPAILHGCTGEGVDLTAPEVTAGTSPNTSFSYFRDSIASSYLYDPNKVLESGTYYIRGINKEGCMNILPVTVIVSLPPLNVTNPEPVVFPATVDLTKTFTAQPGISYGYYKDNGVTKPVDNYTSLKYGGTFYIKAEDIYGCQNILPVNVDINPPPPYSIGAINTFTPNNDGINDNFIVKITGEVTFKSVKIFNRLGQLVFTGKSPTDQWDGNYRGRKLPVGTYYWLFDGVDNFYQTKITKAGPVTIIR